MKKFILSMFVMTSFGFYVIWQNVGNSATNFLAPTPITSTPTPVIPPPKKTGIYNDGTYIGDMADAYYGNVQVQVTISNSRITDVQFLDYPHDRNTSVRINSRAMPMLKQEVVAAQSAKINGVSGASATSSAFVESLMSALNQAKV